MTSANWAFDKKLIDRLYRKIKKSDEPSNRELTIAKIYSKYVKGEFNNSLKYECYQIIKYLASITDKQFINEFSIKKDKDIKKLVNAIQLSTVNNLDQLKHVAAISKYRENTKVDITFSDDFEIDDITNQIVVQLLDNIEQRILGIGGSNYIILRRVSDNKIFKDMITSSNHDEIDEILSECADEQLYDVIINTTVMFSGLQNIRIRYLNCLSWENNIEIRLLNPQDMINSTIYQTKITNISFCQNLKILNSWQISYKVEDFEPLMNLQHLRIINCKYVDGRNLLNDILINNKLQYCDFRTTTSRSAKTPVAILNIETTNSLRYLFIDRQGAPKGVCLDVSNGNFENLRVFDGSVNKMLFSTKSADQLKENLIHSCELQVSTMLSADTEDDDEQYSENKDIDDIDITTFANNLKRLQSLGLLLELLG